jgi:hypothetical protein
MKFKIVPPPRSRQFLREAAAALPLVPQAESDCCARLVADTDLPSRDVAREYLTFLRAVGLVTVTDGQYHRARPEPDDAALATAFRDRTYAAAAVLDALAAEGPLTAGAAFERVRGSVPRWERLRHDDWEHEWRERVRNLLEWAVELGLAERVDGDGEEPPRYRSS